MDPFGPNNSEQGATPQDRNIINGASLQFGKMRRHAGLSQSENQTSGPEEECLSSSVEMGSSYGRSPVLQSMRAENFAKPLSSSPRSPNTRGTWNAHPTRHQQDGTQVPTVKSSGTPHRRYSRGRNRTSSETEKGGRGSREPKARKRGFSGSENANMSGLQCLASEKVWFDKHRYDESERKFYEGLNGPATKQQQSSSHSAGDQDLIARMKSLELENQTLHKVVGDMRAALQKLESRVAQLEKTPAPATVPAVKAELIQVAPAKKVVVEENCDDDDDIDLFGTDDEDEEAARLKQERIEAYAAKKAKKPVLIAKSSILLDVKPWDDETDMTKLEECVRSVQMDGLLWGASKLVPVGYGIKKLQINCVVEDDKVGTDILEEEITKFEDYVQSVDVAAFNKI
ncbi:elongation factor 1-delta-like isoform X2 [Dunckerocampus dactyliophorus]|uniref:elongation factor 1-delta-like isoform X2 n=2 Tax=Dunckerocampus dactyliophorus TaxID=161453 RepID=UPI0024070F9B|nr:elongation factor 1-delta-like isoform X2 [Dunckerocampus dactyliophorus]